MIYSALPVISAIEPQLNTSSMTDALKEVWEQALSCEFLVFWSLWFYLLVLSLFQALAEFYVIDGQYEKAFSIYADVSVVDVNSCTVAQNVYS